jgi:hypothetical protein
VHAETEGNPFFVGEVMRHLVETGAVRRQDDRWVITDPARQVAIPEGVRDVVGRRLARLSKTANTVLSLAAVVGRDWEVEVVMAVSGWEVGALLDAVDEAVRARLVDETGAEIERAQRGRQRHGLSTDVTSTSRPCADGYEVQEAARVDQTTGARGHARRFEHELGGLVLPAAVAQGLGDVLG